MLYLEPGWELPELVTGGHASDADCEAAGTVDPATGDCTECGVSGCREDGMIFPPCNRCVGERFHRAGCPEAVAS